MWKLSHVFGLRTSRKTQNCRISHYKYVWGQPRSLTSDALWKVRMQCQRLDVFISWPKSCVMSPFLSMTALYVAENMISLTNRPKAITLMTPYDAIDLWADLTRPQKKSQKLCKRFPMSYANFQCDPPGGSTAISEKKNSWGVASTLPPLVAVKNTLVNF